MSVIVSAAQVVAESLGVQFPAATPEDIRHAFLCACGAMKPGETLSVEEMHARAKKVMLAAGFEERLPPIETTDVALALFLLGCFMVAFATTLDSLLRTGSFIDHVLFLTVLMIAAAFVAMVLRKDAP